jgi:hypothetical protein
MLLASVGSRVGHVVSCFCTYNGARQHANGVIGVGWGCLQVAGLYFVVVKLHQPLSRSDGSKNLHLWVAIYYLVGLACIDGILCTLVHYRVKLNTLGTALFVVLCRLLGKCCVLCVARAAQTRCR